MNRDQALQKIKKCLNLAKSPNPHEAAAALRQAEKLMLEHGLTESDAELADVLEFSSRTVSSGVQLWESALSLLVAQVFACEKFIRVDKTFGLRGGRTSRHYIFVGIGPAGELAAYAYQVLSRQCAKARLEHIRKQPSNCKPITKTARGDEFALGWVLGVREVLAPSSQEQTNAKLLAQYMQQRHPDLKQVDAKHRAVGRNVSGHDTIAGRRAGQQATLNKGVCGASVSLQIEHRGAA